MYEVVDHIENLTFFSDRMSKQNKSPDPTLVISDASLSTTRWMTKDELSTLFFEQITERQVPLFDYFKSLVPSLHFYFGRYLDKCDIKIALYDSGK